VASYYLSRSFQAHKPLHPISFTVATNLTLQITRPTDLKNLCLVSKQMHENRYRYVCIDEVKSLSDISTEKSPLGVGKPNDMTSSPRIVREDTQLRNFELTFLTLSDTSTKKSHSASAPRMT